MMSEFGEFVDVAFDAPDKALELREDLVYVGGNFRHGARENVDVVVAVHLELAEIGPEGRIAGRRAGEALRSGRGSPRLGRARAAEAVVFVFFLELGNLSVQAFF